MNSLTDVAPAIGEIRADRRAVQQILINLLSNAVKFTPKGGRVALRAKRIGTRLHFSVSDTGIGIAEDDLARLGQPFAQVRNDHTRQFEGTGLGLALVKGLVALHDGTMSIDSTFGQGTTVTISLPIEGPAGSGEWRRRAAAWQTVGGKREWRAPQGKLSVRPRARLPASALRRSAR